MTTSRSQPPKAPASWSRPRYRIVDRNVPLSRSSLWSMSRRWYEHQGPQAWRMAGVPWYITSNSAIAGAYAQVALGVIRDVMAAEPERPPERRRMEILEVCGGLGQFAYLFLARLLPLLASSAHADWQVHYRLTDGAPANVEGWAQHPSFGKLIAGGILEVATFDAAHPEAQAHPEAHAHPRAHDTGNGPLLLVANYALDSLPADLFRVDESGLLERPVTVGVPHAERLAPGVTGLQMTFSERPVAVGTGSAYDDEEFRDILDHYGATLPPGDLLFPTAGLRLLRHLRGTTRGPVVALVSDRACLTPEELGNGAGARIDLQGGPAWATVNLDAVARWVTARGGTPLLRPSLAGNLAFGAFALGPAPGPANRELAASRDPWIETRQAFFSSLTPDDLFALQKQFEEAVPDSLSPLQLVAYLELFAWDPDVFARLAPRLIDTASTLGDRLRRALEAGATKVWSLYFPTGHPDDVPLLLGRLMARLDRLDRAIAWLQAAINLRGAEPPVLLELGACLWRNGQRAEARAAVDAALALDPDDPEARALAVRLADENR